LGKVVSNWVCQVGSYRLTQDITASKNQTNPLKRRHRLPWFFHLLSRAEGPKGQVGNDTAFEMVGPRGIFTRCGPAPFRGALRDSGKPVSNVLSAIAHIGLNDTSHIF
jgi:hypothetical protein